MASVFHFQCEMSREKSKFQNSIRATLFQVVTLCVTSFLYV
jgi:hypothetical protein